MTPMVHALLLVVCIAGTCTMVARWPRRPTSAQVWIALAGGAAVMLVGATVGAHNCRNGQPLTQWLIPGLCVMAVLLFVRPPAARRISCLALLVLGAGLSLDYAREVHEGRYIGASAAGLRGWEWHTLLTGFSRSSADTAVQTE